MRGWIFILFAFVGLGLKAQDRVRFLNGSSKICTVKEITPDYIEVKIGESELAISKLEVLLVEYANGTVEIITHPSQNIVYSPEKGQEGTATAKDEFRRHYASFNSLALFNSDIAAFYEFRPKIQLFKELSFGVGVMGAYNFNIRSSIQNMFISSLGNARKNYDLGVTFNTFPFDDGDDLEIYVGLMIKYTDFNFDKTLIDSVSTPSGTQQVITDIPAHGYQLATLITGGTTSFINEHFFVRTMAGLGAFGLKGDYKTQFNLEINKGNNGAQVKYNFLPKIYLAVNIGFNF